MAEKNNDVYNGKTAGEMLKAARTTGRRKRELATIARQLCIREEFLEALENGDYKKIPELVYILGFARNYAIELELDPKIIVQKIKQEMGIKKNEEPENVPKSDSKTKPAGTPFAKNITGQVISFIARYWKWIVGILVAGAIVATGVLVVFSNAGSQKDMYSSGNATAEVVMLPLPEFRQNVKEQFGMENRASAQIVLQATAETWLKVEDSRGETLFSRVMMPGDVYYAPASDARATVGNAGGLDVFANGKLAPKLGPDHTRKSDIKLNPDTLRPQTAE
ncbi:MAG: DUF4115 domain-containing protein [Rickettsiales bacterium]|jgi:cytoskeletal protein RodZ|nr:DUF4115 domain-containing protein [Rickettsiales bacterium]